VIDGERLTGLLSPPVILCGGIRQRFLIVRAKRHPKTSMADRKHEPQWEAPSEQTVDQTCSSSGDFRGGSRHSRRVLLRFHLPIREPRADGLTPIVAPR
jgi:hypothetical protein